MAWKDITSDPEFMEQPLATRQKVANNYFDQRLIDEDFIKLPSEKQNSIRSRFLDTAMTEKEREGTVGGITGPLKRGWLNVRQAIQVDIPEAIATFAPEEPLDIPLTGGLLKTQPFLVFSKEDLENAANYWDKRIQASYEAAPKKTGKYARAPRSIREFFDPKRISSGVVENVPLLGTFMIMGKEKMLGTLFMSLIEGGDVAREMKDYEEKSSKRIPSWMRKGLVGGIGTINGILEEVSALTVGGRGLSTLSKKRLVKALIGTASEGFEEFSQEATKILGEHSYGNESEQREIVERLWSSAYGGLAAGGVVSGVSQLLNSRRTEEKVESTLMSEKSSETAEATARALSKEKVEDLPPETISLSPVIQQSMSLYEEAVSNLSNEPSPANIAETQAIENSFIKDWRQEHPEDPNGHKLDRLLQDKEIYEARNLKHKFSSSILSPKKEGKVKVTSPIMDAGEALAFEIEPGKIISTPVLKGVPKIEVERALTALHELNKIHNGSVAERVRSVTIAPGSKESWFNSVLKHITARTAEEVKEKISKDLYAGLQSAYNDSFAHVTFNPDGSSNILLRGYAKTSALGNKTAKYMYFIGHELAHATIRANMTPEEIMKAEEVRAKTGKDIEDTKANKQAQMDLDNFMNIVLTDPSLNFQEVPPATPSFGLAKQRQLTNRDTVIKTRLLNNLDVFTEVVQSNGQLYNPEGNPVNAAVDTKTGTLYLSRDIDVSTIGHEGAHIIIDQLGTSDPLVQQGLAMFDGDIEALSDAIGNYYYKRTMEPNLMRRLGSWLRDLWARFKAYTGIENSPAEVVSMLNNRMAGATFVKQEGIGRLGFQVKEFADPESTSSKRHIFKKILDVSDKISEQSRAAKQITKASKKIKKRKYPSNPKTYAEKGSVQRRIDKMVKVERELMHKEVYSKMPAPTKMPDEELLARASYLIGNSDIMEELLDRVLQAQGLNPIETKAVQLYLQKRQSEVLRHLILDNPEEGVKLALTEMARRDERILNINDQNAGRSLHALKNIGEADRNFYMDMINRIQRGTLSEEDKILYKDAFEADDVEAIHKLAAKYRIESEHSRWHDLRWAIFYEGILSGTSNLTNIFSNTAFLLYQPVSKLSQASVDAALNSPVAKKLLPALKGRERKVYFNEALALWSSFVDPKNLTKAGRAARTSWKTGQVPPDLNTKWQIELGTITGAFERFAILKPYARALTPFSRGLVVMDVFFKSLAGDAYIEAQKTREMKRTGKSYGQIAVTDKMKENARSFMNYVTFMDSPEALAQSTGSVRRWINDVMPLGRAVIPFVNTSANIFNRGLERIPGVGLWTNWQRIKRRPIDRDTMEYKEPVFASKEFVTAVSNQVEGAIMAFVLLGLLNDEDRITGATPTNSAKRRSFFARGKQPYSIRVGDHWISYRRVEPFNIIISSIVAVRDAWNDLEAEDTDMVDVFTKLSFDVIKGLSGSLYTDNLFRALESEYGFKNFLLNLPASFVPYSGLMRQINRSVEAMQNDGRYIRENHEWFSSIANVLPWFISDELGITPPPKIDAFGQEIKVPGGVLQQWLPFKWQTETKDPIEEELYRLGVYPGLPSRTLRIGHEDVILPIEVYRDYSIYYGSLTKEAIRKAMSLPGYSKKSDKVKLKLLDNRISKVRSKARNRMKKEYRILQK